MRLPRTTDEAVGNRFVPLDLALMQNASILRPDMMNHISYEIINAIIDSGLTVTELTTDENLLSLAIDARINNAITALNPGIITQDEGITLGQTTNMNFVGDGVSATYNSGTKTTTVSIVSPTSAIAIRDEGTNKGNASTINFVGSNITANVIGGVATVTVGGATGTNGPAFRAFFNGSLALPSAGAYHLISFSSVEFNIGSGYNTGNYRFQPGVAGYYQINATITGQPANPTIPLGTGLQLRRNGGTVDQGAMPYYLNGNSCVTLSTILYLSSGDFIDCYGYQAAGNGDPNARFLIGGSFSAHKLDI